MSGIALNKNLLHSKGTSQQNERKGNPVEWEKIFSSHKSNKGLMSKIKAYFSS